MRKEGLESGDGHEEQLNWGEYARALVARWPVILTGWTTVALVGLTLLWLAPPSYQAASYVLITRPQYVLRFDPRFETTVDSSVADLVSVSRAVISLATSEEILVRVLRHGLLSSSTADTDIDLLRSSVRARPTSDPTLVMLEVKGADQDEVAALANIWADELVSYVTELYGIGPAQSQHLATQISAAQASLTQAERDLATFHNQSMMKIHQGEVDSLATVHQTYLTDLESNKQLRTMVQALADTNASFAESEEVTPADALTALLLQIRGYGGAEDFALHIELNDLSAGGATRGQLRGQLSELDDKLKRKDEDIRHRVDQVAARLLWLRGRIQEEQSTLQRLDLAYRVAHETYLTLARKADEMRIAEQESRASARVASRAVPPTTTSGPSRLLLFAGIGAFGLLAGISIAAIIEWRTGAQPPRRRVASGPHMSSS